MIKDITIPEISENVTSGTVVEVLVKAGETVDIEDPVIEFETDKAVVEIPSPYKGRITEVLAQVGDEMNVGDTVAKIETEAESAAEEAQPKEKGEQKEPEREWEEKEPEKKEDSKDESAAAEEVAEAEKKASKEADKEEAAQPEEKEAAKGKEAEKKPPRGKAAAPKTPEKAVEGRKEDKTRKAEGERLRDEAQQRGPAPASPSVRRFARELGVDIHAVRAAGPGERISEGDVKAHVKKALEEDRGAEPGTPSGEQPALPDFSRWGEIETRELTGVRRLTAGSMAVAWRTVAHVTQFERADITSAREFIRQNAEPVAEQGGKLTLTAVLMKICAAALNRFPRFNASIDPANNRLILKKYIHIGLAVDTERGLLVPVVRNADRKSITELAVEIVDLAKRARNKKVTPDEMEGGTFTISNQGGIGGTDFTPVVYWPQAAILGVSRAAVEPRYTNGEFRPREILPLALSYDHRILDGADAARFMRWIRDSLEHPLTLHLN
jgi:pyruvate dehydrogenase E2 component (dihydrolipoamide acetyltransferase)